MSENVPNNANGGLVPPPFNEVIAEFAAIDLLPLNPRFVALAPELQDIYAGAEAELAMFRMVAGLQGIPVPTTNRRSMSIFQYLTFLDATVVARFNRGE